MILSHSLLGDCWGTLPGDLDDFPPWTRWFFGACGNNSNDKLQITEPRIKTHQPGQISMHRHEKIYLWARKLISGICYSNLVISVRWRGRLNTWMHCPKSGDISFFKLSRIKPKIFSTQAVNCCLNKIAGYLASMWDKPSSKPWWYLKDDLGPYEEKRIYVSFEEAHTKVSAN